MNTPVTDAAEEVVFDRGMQGMIPADLARQLERDRARLLNLAKDITNCPDSPLLHQWAKSTLASLEIKE